MLRKISVLSGGVSSGNPYIIAEPILETDPHAYQYGKAAIRLLQLGITTTIPDQCTRPDSPSSFLVTGGLGTSRVMAPNEPAD
jgi:hypothetical protein